MALAMSTSLPQKLPAQDLISVPTATVRVTCNGVSDDALKTDIETLVAFAVANANIDLRAAGKVQIPRFSFKDMPEEPTRRFIADLRKDGKNGFGGPGFGVVIECKDKPAP